MGQSLDSAAARLKRIFRSLLAELLPEVARGRHVPFRAKVLSVQPMAAGRSDALTPRYVATVKPLAPDGQEDPRRPAIAGVAIQTLWAGPSGEGLFRLPGVGSIVRVGFDYGDPSLPVILGVLTEGQQVPAAALGELVIQAGPATWIRCKADGKVVIEAPEIWAGDGATEPIPLGTQLRAWLDAHVHLGNLGGPTSPPTVLTTPVIVSAQHKVK